MAYDEDLATRVRGALADHVVSERKMFGGLTFLVHGHMACGIIGDQLMVRVGSAAYPDAVRRPHARPMDFTGKPLTGFVYVGPAGLRGARALAAWVGRGTDFVTSLPAKKATKKKPARPRPRTSGRTGARTGTRTPARTR